MNKTNRRSFFSTITAAVAALPWVGGWLKSAEAFDYEKFNRDFPCDGTGLGGAGDIPMSENELEIHRGRLKKHREEWAATDGCIEFYRVASRWAPNRGWIHSQNMYILFPTLNDARRAAIRIYQKGLFISAGLRNIDIRPGSQIWVDVFQNNPTFTVHVMDDGNNPLWYSPTTPRKPPEERIYDNPPDYKYTSIEIKTPIC